MMLEDKFVVILVGLDVFEGCLTHILLNEIGFVYRQRNKPVLPAGPLMVVDLTCVARLHVRAMSSSW